MVVDTCISSITKTLQEKALEYQRNDNPMHNFDCGARITGQTRERVIHGFALKHQISINDMRDDLDNGILPTTDMIDEKFGDAINYLIIEKASMLHRVIGTLGKGESGTASQDVTEL